MDIEGLIQVPLLQTLPRLRVQELARGMPLRELPTGQVVASTASMVTYVIPLVATLVGLVVLSERLEWYQPWAG